MCWGKIDVFANFEFKMIYLWRNERNERTKSGLKPLNDWVTNNIINKKLLYLSELWQKDYFHMNLINIVIGLESL